MTVRQNAIAAVAKAMIAANAHPSDINDIPKIIVLSNYTAGHAGLSDRYREVISDLESTGIAHTELVEAMVKQDTGAGKNYRNVLLTSGQKEKKIPLAFNRKDLNPSYDNSSDTNNEDFYNAIREKSNANKGDGDGIARTMKELNTSSAFGFFSVVARAFIALATGSFAPLRTEANPALHEAALMQSNRTSGVVTATLDSEGPAAKMVAMLAKTYAEYSKANGGEVAPSMGSTSYWNEKFWDPKKIQKLDELFVENYTNMEAQNPQDNFSNVMGSQHNALIVQHRVLIKKELVKTAAAITAIKAEHSEQSIKLMEINVKLETLNTDLQKADPSSVKKARTMGGVAGALVSKAAKLTTETTEQKAQRDELKTQIRDRILSLQTEKGEIQAKFDKTSKNLKVLEENKAKYEGVVSSSRSEPVGSVTKGQTKEDAIATTTQFPPAYPPTLTAAAAQRAAVLQQNQAARDQRIKKIKAQMS